MTHKRSAHCFSGDAGPIIVDAEVDQSADEDGAESSIDVIGILETEGIVLDEKGDFDGYPDDVDTDRH